MVVNPAVVLMSSTLTTHIFSIVKIYVFWTLSHYISQHLYHHFCSPKTFIDIILTPFYVQAPHCKVFHWFHKLSFNTIDSFTATGITWLSNIVISYSKNSYASCKTT